MIAGQERDQGRDFLGPAEAASWDHALYGCLVGRIGHRPRVHLGSGYARCNRVHAHAIFDQLLAENAGQEFYRALGGGWTAEVLPETVKNTKDAPT